MTATIEDYVNVRERLQSLGCKFPSGLAILPSNFETAESIQDFRQPSEASTVRKLFRQSRLPYEDVVDRGVPYVQNNSFEWVGPTLFFAASLLSHNPDLVDVAIEVMSKHVMDFFNGFSLGGDNAVSLDIVVETKKTTTYKKVCYKGPVEGLKDLPRVIKATANE